MATHRADASANRMLLSKVPEVTAYFWIIKVLCTTVGETAADFLNVNLDFGLTGTSIATGVLLVVALAVQFARRPLRARPVLAGGDAGQRVRHAGHRQPHRQPRRPARGEHRGVRRAARRDVRRLVRVERTLSIHSIFTPAPRGVLLARDPVHLRARHGRRGPDGAGARARLPRVRHRRGRGHRRHRGRWRLGLHSVLAFWIIYVLTRPLGASIGDYLSQPRTDGGLGLGATLTSVIFLAGIIAVVVYLSVTKADVIRGGRDGAAPTGSPDRDESARGGLLQTVVVVGVLLWPASRGTPGARRRCRARRPPRSVHRPRSRRPVTRPGTARPDPEAAHRRRLRCRSWAISRSSGPSPRTPATSSTAATSPGRRPASPTSRPPGTTRRQS